VERVSTSMPANNKVLLQRCALVLILGLSTWIPRLAERFEGSGRYASIAFSVGRINLYEHRCKNPQKLPKVV
jgi:hypothetical protein